MSSKPKVGVSLYSYGADIMKRRITIKECIDHSASLGVQGIEFVDNRHIPNFPHQRIYDLLELRDYVESFGMKVSCYSTYISESTGIDTSLEGYVKEFRKQVAETKTLGAKILRPAIFAPRDLKMDESTNFTVKRIKDMTLHVLPDLKKHDVVWGAEIHAPVPPEIYLELVKEVNNEYFGLVPDFSVWQIKGLAGVAGASSVELYKQCMPYTVHVHAKAHVFDANGEEPNTPFNKLIPIAKESGFNGYITAEFEGWRLGNFSDSRKIVETHVNLIRRYL